MKASIEKVFLELELEEAYSLYSKLRIGIECSIKEHWKNHPDAFEKYEANSMRIMRGIAPLLGRSYDEDFSELKKLLQELSSEQKTTK